MAKKNPAQAAEVITIKPPNFRRLEFTLTGVSPLMQARFSKKAADKMMSDMMAGSTAKSKKVREKRDPKRDMQEATHFSTDGWIGIHAGAFRNACIDVCRMVGFKMTHAKMSIFIEPDGHDKIDGQPLVKLLDGNGKTAKMGEETRMPVPNANGKIDIRVRPLWRSWSVRLKVRYDADQFTANDVANLLERAGMQVGVGEGRPFSKNSNGMGYGLYTIKARKAA